MNDHPDDPHVQWARDAAALEARLEGMPEDDDVREPAHAELHRLWDLIGTTPSRTAAGAREQVLRAARVHALAVLPDDPELAGLHHAAATLERLAGEEKTRLG